MSELERLEKLAESQKREKAKVEGRLEALMEELEEEGFTSVNAAREELTLIEKKITRMKKTFNTKLEQFKKQHATELS